MTDKKNKRFKWSDSVRDAKRLILAHRSHLAVGGALMLINRLVGFVLPASSKYIVDEVLIKGRRELLVIIALAAGAATLAQTVTSFLMTLTLGAATQRAIIEMRKNIQAHVGRLPIRYFDSTQSGNLISRIMNDADGLRNLIGGGLLELVGSMITGMIAVGALFYLNWRLTALTLVILLAFTRGMSYGFRKLKPLFRERAEIYSRITGRLAEFLGGIRIVKVYTAEKREELVFARLSHSLLRNIKKSMIGLSMVNASSSVVIGAVSLVIIIIGGNSILSGRMTLGDLMMYIFFSGLMAAPLTGLANIGSQVTEAFAGLDRIRELMKMPSEDAEDSSKEAIDEIQGEVVFENVCFEYDPGAPVLKNISFRAPAGSTTALVGSSGSGKSTLTSLIMNFNLPISGKIKIDGRDLDTLKLHDYRSHLGVVLQDNFLFDGTIADNISFSRPQASREEVENVSRIAMSDEFIMGFDKKYDTVVGERGVKLSGGQRQRIAIARALLAEPAILILDEATSSLDSESEGLIQVGLRSLRKGRTTFVIAHRLSTIRSADQILVMESGEVVERGTHEELLAAGGRYRQLYDNQYNLEHDRFVNPGEDGVPEESVREVPVVEIEHKALRPLIHRHNSRLGGG